MKKIFVKTIIYLFEKYALDEWIEKQQLEEKERIMKEYNMQNDRDFIEFQIENHRRPLREAYENGLYDGKNNL